MQTVEKKDYTICKFENGNFSEQAIEAILEIPMTIYLNDKEVVTLLTTAKYPKFLAVGFLKSDAYITTKEQILDVSITNLEDRIVAKVYTSHDPWKNRVMEYSITSGCGKGTNFGRNVATISKRKIDSQIKVSPTQILNLATELKKRSTLHARTRGCHNSSLCSPDKMIYFREDIGRHNAIDMLVGQCFYEDVSTTDKFIVSTGRIASEILLKSVRIGVPLLASTAVATSFSIELARKIGITLIGNISDTGFYIYNDSNNILCE